MIGDDQSFDMAALGAGYVEGRFTPQDVMQLARRRIQQFADRNAWIHVLSDAELEPYLINLESADPASKPLYGIPFAIKDNIDLAGVPTTAACPAFAYTPDASAEVVRRLVAAGAVPLGKTNLDQFATGLVGTRSPYGVCRNSMDPDIIAGGSSSGSAVATALGMVSFALGTDTAGSGRVPAALNNLVGLKPTRGLLSTRGVVPACRTLDCVSVFALTGADAHAALQVAQGFDEQDPYARRRAPVAVGFSPTRFRFGVPHACDLEFFGNEEYARLFQEAVTALEQLGGERIDIEFTPFLEAARLLYQGPWVAERYLACKSLIEKDPAALHPVTREIIATGAEPRATEAFAAQYRLAALTRAAEQVWSQVEVMVTPTIGTHYTVDQVLEDPIQLNSNLGYYTNFMNLLDLSAVAAPAGRTEAGFPFGVTLFAPAFQDQALLALVDRLHRHTPATVGATNVGLESAPPLKAEPEGWVTVAVCGAHLEGLPLNHQLTERGGRLQEATTTAPRYRFYALSGGPPERPGLIRVEQGAAVDVELWRLPSAQFGSFVAGIPAPLGIGKLELADGRWVSGFICEPCGVEGARDITDLGGWRAYLAQQAATA